MTTIPSEALDVLSRSDLSARALRLALALLRAAAEERAASVDELGRAAGLLRRAARSALSNLVGPAGLLLPWVRRTRTGRADVWALVGAARAYQVGAARAYQVGTEPPHTPLGGSWQEERSAVSEPRSLGSREGETNQNDKQALEDEPHQVPEDQVDRLLPLAQALADEGSRAADERAAEERRPVKAAGVAEWTRALWALAVVLGGQDGPDVPAAGRYLLAGLTVEPKAGWIGWRRILAVAPLVSLRWTFRRAVAAGWGVSPGWSPKEQAGRDPLAVMAGVQVPEPAPVVPPWWATAKARLLALVQPDAAALVDVVMPGDEPGTLVVPNRLYLDGLLAGAGDLVDQVLPVPARWRIDPYCAPLALR